MEDRDRDEMRDETPSNVGRNKSEDWNSEPGRSSGASEIEGSDLESDSDLGSDRGFGESGNINRGIEREH